MNIEWGSLGLVGLVSLAATVAVVVLIAFALVGLSARTPVAEGEAPRPLSPGSGTAVAAVCLLAVVAIVAYGLYLIIA